MFQQEINLYTAFIPVEAPKTLLTWKRMWLSQGLFLFLFTIMALQSYWQVNALQKRKIKTEREASLLEQRFYKLKNTYPSEFFNQDVAVSIQKLNQQMVAKEKILAKIANRGLFSDNLTALSESIFPNVWLTQIVIDKSGDIIRLRGKSENTAELQSFLTKLSNSPIYQHYNLSVKSISDNNATETRGDMIFEIDLTRTPV